MRLLKTLTLNRRAIYDSRVALDTSNNFTLADSTVMTLPKSSSSLPGVEGQVRYNTSTYEVEVFQGNGAAAAWRNLRYKEPTAITVQALGFGDANNLYFGFLSPVPSAPGGITWNLVQKAKQLIVLVENVLQLAGTNYDLVQNPTIPGQTYNPKTAGITAPGETTINFDLTDANYVEYPSVDITGAIVSGDAAFQLNTVVLSYTTNAAGQLTSIVFDKPTVSTSIADLTMIDISDATNTISDGSYWIKFTSAVPQGKPVTVIHGFDQ